MEVVCGVERRLCVNGRFGAYSEGHAFRPSAPPLCSPLLELTQDFSLTSSVLSPLLPRTPFVLLSLQRHT